MVMKGGWWFGSCLIEGVWVMGVAMEGCGYCGSGKCGWKALVNGTPTEILRTNHALRGVILPEGPSHIVMTYEPASFRWGVRAMVAAGCILGIWMVVLTRRRIHRECV